MTLDTVMAATLVHDGQQIRFSPLLYRQGTTPPGANTAGISGVVLDSTTNEPLTGVHIQAAHGGQTQGLVSAADGRFEIGGITSAELNLGFSLDGYRPVELSLPTTRMRSEIHRSGQS